MWLLLVPHLWSKMKRFKVHHWAGNTPSGFIRLNGWEWQWMNLTDCFFVFLLLLHFGFFSSSHVHSRESLVRRNRVYEIGTYSTVERHKWKSILNANPIGPEHFQSFWKWTFPSEFSQRACCHRRKPSALPCAFHILPILLDSQFQMKRNQTKPIPTFNRSFAINFDFHYNLIHAFARHF